MLEMSLSDERFDHPYRSCNPILPSDLLAYSSRLVPYAIIVDCLLDGFGQFGCGQFDPGDGLWPDA